MYADKIINLIQILQEICLYKEVLLYILLLNSISK